MTNQDQERRRHKRLKLECPVAFFTRAGKVVAEGKSLDMSDGGTFVSVPTQAVEKLAGRVNLTFSVPRTTENTYMLEDFACQADVVRRQDDVAQDAAGIAIAFTKPMSLALEV